ncbi:MAG: response regulator, partial [Flavobacterium sp.]|nr:response regulator [Flavobacterium sp.]
YKNYDVKTAENGQDALDVLEYWTPDLIICDIMMPVMDGNMLHEIIKEDQLLSPIPFIFLTAKNENNLMRQCLLDGADDFLSKPFKINELTTIIETKLARFEKIKNSYNNLYIGKQNTFQHEINTPLHGILGFTNLLIKDEGSFEKEQIHQFYESIKVSGERLNRTLKNVILFQNFQNNLIPFVGKSSTQILKSFLNVKTRLFQIYENQEKRIRFTIDKASIKIDEMYLDFILFELIDNAMKFSPKGKFISVNGRRYNNEFYELVIQDFGIGLSEEELKKIGAAQQFNREKREQQGLGLGLFLSKSIIKKANGVFSIISKENEGTSVKIFLPLSL